MLTNIDEVVTGMKLAEDVMIQNGATLLNTSTVLTGNLIEKLKQHGIQQIQIEGESSTADNDSDKAPDKPLDKASEKPSDKIPDKPLDKAPEKPSDENVNTLPKIIVTVENEGMAAYLCVEPTDAPNEQFTVADLKNALYENDVVFGIKESLLEEAVKKWEEAKEIIEIDNIAMGTPPTPAKEGPLDICVEYIKNSGDLEKAKNAKYCWELLAASIPIERVDKGDIIAIKDFKMPEIPGMDVHANEINSDEVIKTEVKLGENVEVVENNIDNHEKVDAEENENIIENVENTIYKSFVTGLAYYVEEKLFVLPINFDGSAELSISSDNMKAELTVHPPVEGGNHPPETSIKELLREKNITFGIDQELISATMEKLKEGVYPENPVTIAEGEPPVDGKDGKVRYLFKTASSLKPDVDVKGNADYKNISIIQFVIKGTKLARLIPPTEGKSGKDILANDIPFNESTLAVMPVGINTEVRPDDPNVLIAQINGNVRLNGQLVEVFEGFTIKGDVDYSTGDINYDKSVIIGGDIKSGFSVNCGGDIEVGGTIEDAAIRSRGSILCKYGFVGKGKGVIECDGDVHINFINNQTIRCRGSVNIAKEALNSKIFSCGTITVAGKNLSVAGGSLVAWDGIICTVVGNSSGIHTDLEVGLDFTLLDRLQKEKKELAQTREKRKNLSKGSKKLDHMMKTKKKLSEKQLSLYVKLTQSIAEFDLKIEQIDERIKLIMKRMLKTGSPFMKILYSAMPGTVLKIGNQSLEVQKEIIGPKTVRLINDKIRIF